MPQLIIIGAVLAGGWIAWKAVKREMARVGRELDRARGRPTETLMQDPKTGKYKVKGVRNLRRHSVRFFVGPTAMISVPHAFERDPRFWTATGSLTVAASSLSRAKGALPTDRLLLPGSPPPVLRLERARLRIGNELQQASRQDRGNRCCGPCRAPPCGSPDQARSRRHASRDAPSLPRSFRATRSRDRCRPAVPAASRPARLRSPDHDSSAARSPNR